MRNELFWLIFRDYFNLEKIILQSKTIGKCLEFDKFGLLLIVRENLLGTTGTMGHMSKRLLERTKIWAYAQ